MARGSSSDKLAAWRQRMVRFHQFAGTVAAFCDDEGVSTPAFYQWRRKLAAAGRHETTPRGGSPDVRDRSVADGNVGTGFAAVRVVGAVSVVGHLPGGTRLEIPTGDPAILRLAIETLARVDAERAGGAEC